MVKYTTNSKGKKVTTQNRAAASIWIDDTDGVARITAILEKTFGKDTAKVYDEAYDKAMALPEEIMRQWFSSAHHRTGRTAKAYIPGKTLATFDKDVEGYTYFRVYGYDKRKSCVPIFFEYGTPRRPPYHIEPEFVIYYAVADFKDTIRQEIRRVLVQKLKEYQTTQFSESQLSRLEMGKS